MKSPMVLLLMMLMTGCAMVEVPLTTKSDAFPNMYTGSKPLSLLIVPAINESDAMNAGDYLNVTVSQPFVEAGYYVLPVAIVSDLLEQRGVTDGKQVRGLSPRTFGEEFGADAILYLTITSWDREYWIASGNVTVGLEYELISTRTLETLWSYIGEVTVDTTSNSGDALVDLIATTLQTVTTRYVDVARSLHNEVVLTLPYGEYHPQSGLDSEFLTVNKDRIETETQ